jgi:ubiquinol-cytochrome c reductase cytochrome c subunit
VPRPLALVLALLSLYLGACGYTARRATPYRPSDGLPPSTLPAAAGDQGKLLYLRDCAWCHAADGSGTTRGPALTDVGAAGADFYLSTGRMPLADPKETPVHRNAQYTPSEIQAITDYVASLGPGPEIPTFVIAPQVSQGEELYQGNCAACHSATGVGGALTSGDVAPTLLKSTPRQIAEAIRIGPGNMPVFDSGSLSDNDVGAIVGYVRFLEGPQDRGGLPLGRLGPIGEGAIGWLVGLGILLLVSRRIGTKVQ